MIEVVGNIWTYPATFRCIPTCGVVDGKGNLVMGAGLALQAKMRFPDLPEILGRHVSYCGNVPKLVSEHNLISFPTKNHWKYSSCLPLILAGTNWLWEMLRESEDVVVLPRLGCGLGKLCWHTEVKPILEKRLLGDRFVVVME